MKRLLLLLVCVSAWATELQVLNGSGNAVTLLNGDASYAVSVPVGQFTVPWVYEAVSVQRGQAVILANYPVTNTLALTVPLVGGVTVEEASDPMAWFSAGLGVGLTWGAFGFTMRMVKGIGANDPDKI